MFPKKLDGIYEDIDCYIDCYKNTRVFHYGKGILEAYIPSAKRGRNIIRSSMEEFGDSIISNITENDSEILFRFKAKDFDKLKKYLMPKTSGANISPFSSKNLPKNKEYKISEEDMEPYKEIVNRIGLERMVELSHITKKYIQSLATKKNTWEDIKADMALKGLKGKNYIHSIGEWDNFIRHLERKLK